LRRFLGNSLYLKYEIVTLCAKFKIDGNSYLCIKGVMKAFVARGVTLGPETSVEGHNTVRATNANYARGTYKILCPVEVLNFIII
jgi:hypothetical protein